MRYADVVDRIGLALGDATPSDAASFRANALALRDELSALDGEFRKGLAECRTRVMITNHAAFGYLADAYDLVQRAISSSRRGRSQTRGTSPSSPNMRGPKASPWSSPRTCSPEAAETLAGEAGLDTAVLSPLEGLTESQVAAGDDYFSIMRRNLETLRDGLDCT